MQQKIQCIKCLYLVAKHRQLKGFMHAVCPFVIISKHEIDY